MDFLHKVIFVSKKLITEAGDVYFDNYFVTVKSVDDDLLVVVKADSAEENLPADEEFYSEAEPGIYELDNGAIHENPDYIGEFVIYENDIAYEKFKHEH